MYILYQMVLIRDTVSRHKCTSMTANVITHVTGNQCWIAISSLWLCFVYNMKCNLISFIVFCKTPIKVFSNNAGIGFSINYIPFLIINFFYQTGHAISSWSLNYRINKSNWKYCTFLGGKGGFLWGFFLFRFF